MGPVESIEKDMVSINLIDLQASRRVLVAFGATSQGGTNSADSCLSASHQIRAQWFKSTENDYGQFIADRITSLART